MGGGHAVTCYGWGPVNGVDAWHCMNSWGGGWGEQGKGIFYIKKGVNMANIEDNGCVTAQIDVSQISGLPPNSPPAPPAAPSPPSSPPPPTPPPPPGPCETRGTQVSDCADVSVSDGSQCSNFWATQNPSSGSWSVCDPVYECSNTDNGAEDRDGDHCTGGPYGGYTQNPNYCGERDARFESGLQPLVPRVPSPCNPKCASTLQPVSHPATLQAATMTTLTSRRTPCAAPAAAAPW